ncbi:hypothetical protein Asppvi_009335 [Aspergillus pseudoviridinutans]|uniref:phosphoethanolamine N-methyltransferase n=1 Tax=Aspergillus pseudoviridinutans TaxID=1517512 RepID=A0A9P3BME2_9EURO|nr:uncharacterized protein Asppvi_009335 [Aspergillus pseudoviridinutans]GIJ90381.1 hypothetical protein Asppvi_009335 [Aspergillus pseudoviridinutans]
MTVAEFYDSVAASYEAAFAHNAGLLKLVNKAMNYLPAQAHVLDIGCGTGRPVASILADAGHQVVGIDIAKTMVELSQKNVPRGRFEVADMRNYDGPAGTEHLDAVFNIFSLFRFNREEIESFIKRWGSWININGLLCIGTMAVDDCPPDRLLNGADTDSLGTREVRNYFMGQQRVHTLFTRAGWVLLLQQNGFEVVDQWMELFVPPECAQTDDAPFYYIIAKKVK